MSRMTRRRTLITSPLAWQMTAAPVSHPPIPVLAARGGTQVGAARRGTRGYSRTMPV